MVHCQQHLYHKHNLSRSSTHHPNHHHHHYHHLPSSSSLNHHHLRMFIRSAALFAAIYGHGAFAATISEQSCEAGDAGTSCSNCVNPLTSSYQPVSVANLWASACCTAKECDTDGTNCDTKKFCYIYSMVSGSNSQYADNLPSGGLVEATCTTGQLQSGTFAQLAWSLEGQCTTANAVSSFSHMTLLSF